MKKKLLGLALLLANSMVLSLGYAKQTDELTMQLSWNHQFQFAGYYAAQEKGFYKEAGLSVQLLEGGIGVHCDERILRDVEYCNAPGSVVKQYVEGQPIVVLASILQHSPIVLITKKSSNLYTPRDLIGKKVEVLRSGKPIPEIQAMLQNEGIRLEQLNVLENTRGVTALLADKVDAIYGFSSSEPYQLRKQGVDYNLIKPKRYGIDFYGDVLITSHREVNKHPERTKKFLEASLRGWRYAMANQQEMADLIMEKYPPGRPRESLLAEAKVIEELMLPKLIEIGRINPERWRHTADTLVSLGLMKSGYSLAGFIYDNDEEQGYLIVIVSLLTGLVLMTIGMIFLWLYNKRLNIERAEAQERLRKVREIASQGDLLDAEGRQSVIPRKRPGKSGR